MKRIKRLSIKNFKSLLDVTIDFPTNSPLTILIGLNGCGKSTVLQAFDFVGQLMRGDLNEWFERRNWRPADLVTKIPTVKRRYLIDVEVEGYVNSWINNDTFTWSCAYNPLLGRCTAEQLLIDGSSVLSVKDGKLHLNGQESDIAFEYSGAILSQLQDKVLEQIPHLKEIKHFLASVHSFDLLSPRNLRVRSRYASTIGLSGENLTGYLSGLTLQQRMKIQQQLIKFYSFIYDYDIKSLRGGWKDLQLWEIGSPFRTETGTAGHYAYSRSAQHVNDGTLRLLAIIAALHSDNGFILFDEIENGFNPIIIKKVIELMLEADKQVIVTTHSPEVLQYIPDEQAKESVKFLYRAEDGSTAIENFFMLEEAQQKLEMLSPGEVFLDIELERLAEELRQKAKPSPKAER